MRLQVVVRRASVVKSTVSGASMAGRRYGFCRRIKLHSARRTVVLGWLRCRDVACQADGKVVKVDV
jgi:hypothetical protein